MNALDQERTNLTSSSNMLYPKEDPANNRLMYACRTCPFGQPAESACIYRNELSNTVGDTAGITQDVGSDPTVGLPGFCSCCGDEIICPECNTNCGIVDVQDDAEEGVRRERSCVAERNVMDVERTTSGGSGRRRAS